MAHVVLLGDSIFDNAAYVRGGPDVARQLQDRLPTGSRASLLAVDGAVARGVARQLERMPADVTHLVVSVGGNDALGASGVLREGVRSVAEAVTRLAAIGEEFARSYAAMLDEVLARGLPTAVCTVYDANYPEPEGRIIVTALAVFNDAITRTAFARRLPLIDLRLICDEPGGYANPIEPSVQGGAKIADAIAQAVSLDAWGIRSVVIAR
ncbi:MAG: hypothetical protein AVDCRST_MAG91-3184 [uncultured Sphingomonadaceae bacterium]|uniref:SGNH hydrolase-type esterase domain-containing protein n=1 Tax=uncultured Sphingomonadaceae bacterium TaxID=169976 RepID=A0A6J4TVV3_9SPHN|nr:MAG: hypothetical protein AVDCRST_MAG91-3184 [uncultured Sphingomonadaceae bacterium]